MYFRLVFTITNAVITSSRLGFKRCKASFSLWSPPCYNDCRKCLLSNTHIFINYRN
ncbi:hypothetical protein POPTR_017G098166v4 [Populus trichocarpa]|uniref:Uncharacterized protein n=1 Tax=Populus trichocarpa TaxID=3694 RepID=A0ACC0RQS4_POPTR|nr:hypothetical protein POPTR_017G098166v4 [Populus trichocarpa]